MATAVCFVIILMGYNLYKFATTPVEDMPGHRQSVYLCADVLKYPSGISSEVISECQQEPRPKKVRK